MKKTGRAKSDAKKLMGKMVAPGAAFGAAAPVVDKREQRRRRSGIDRCERRRNVSAGRHGHSVRQLLEDELLPRADGLRHRGRLHVLARLHERGRHVQQVLRRLRRAVDGSARARAVLADPLRRLRDVSDSGDASQNPGPDVGRVDNGYFWSRVVL